MNRKEINPAILYIMLGWKQRECDGFTLIEDEITSSDSEDGGADHEYVIQEDKTKKFYAGNYCDWDISNTDYDEANHTIDGRCDLNTSLREVFPKTITKVVYE